MMAVSRHGNLAEHADTQKVDGEDLGAELPQLLDALIGEHHADQEAEQPDDGQGVDAGLLDLIDGGGDARFVLAWR